LKLKVLDLFSGIGGFSLGLERTGGFQTVAFCELDEYCNKVLKKHWPGVKNYGDITTARFKESVDLVTAGFPCQDISYAGEGAGLAGERSGLFWHILHTVRMVGLPKLLLENVAALLDRGMGAVLGSLAQIGYDTEWHCIQAADIGAPHLRDRVWIFANPRQEPFAQPILTEVDVSESRNRNKKQWRQNRFFPEVASLCPEVLQGWLDRSKANGMDDGVSHRFYRLGQCGNSVLPQIPELMGYAVLRRLNAS